MPIQMREGARFGGLLAGKAANDKAVDRLARAELVGLRTSIAI
jgi:hypothetical protein